MLGGRSIQLARVFGIRFGASPSWFVVLFLIIWLLSGQYEERFPGGETKAFVLATITALLFFLSILLHEVGHAVVARRNGIGITGIDLWLFGGVAHLKRDTQSPGEEFRVAAAGPAVTLVIAALCLGGAQLAGGGEAANKIGFTPEAGLEATSVVLAWIGTINVTILLFNLIPAFPLDGGRIARAAIWKVTGNRIKATTIAARLGQGFGYLLGGVGIYLLLTDQDPINAIWLILIGFMIHSFARGAEAQTRVSEQLEGVRVADVMDHEPVTLPGEVKLDRALDEFFIRYGWDWFPVTDVSGRFLGLITREAAEQVPEALRQGTSVAQAMAADTESTFRIGTDEPLENLLGAEGLRRLGAMMAVDGEGILRGVVTVDQVRRALQPAPVT